MKTVLITIIVLIFISSEILAQETYPEYVYVVVSGKLFSKKLNIEIDFGDEPEQIAKSEKFEVALEDKTSYISVLNYMFEQGYELINTFDYTYLYQGTGGTIGIANILKKKQE
jgi:hypothetical protein